jgi:hypothetical protein
MALSLRRLFQFIGAIGIFVAGPAKAGDGPVAGNLLGQRGVLRASAALPQTAGWFCLGSDFQYFKTSGFLTKNDQHARMANSYSLNWAPIRFLETAVALHVISDTSRTGDAAEELQVAVGDPEIALKGGAEIGRGFSAGGLVDVRFPSGVGFFEMSPSATSLLLSALGSWAGPSRFPVGVHLNVGFFVDGSKNLFSKPSELSAAQRYSAQLSSFHRLISRLALEYATSHASPFVELSLEPYLGSGAPSFAASPGLVSVGARVWPTKKRGLQILAALDVGVTGVGDGTRTETNDAYSFVVPRWNFLLQLSYRFEPFAAPEVIVSRRDDRTGRPTKKLTLPNMGIIRGIVLDGQTEKPLWNAQVYVEGEEASNLAVNPADGAFRTYRVEVGKQVIVAAADGYSLGKQEVEVLPDTAREITFRLTRRTVETPGTLRGTIRAVSGKQVPGATILIPEIDQTIQVGEEGTFSITLKPGEYKVVVSSKGYRTQTKSIRIQEGSTVIFNVDLYK